MKMSGQDSAPNGSLTLGQFVKFTYPDVLSKTYCVPPLHFKGVHYDRVCVPGTADLPALVRKAPISAQPGPSGAPVSAKSGVPPSSGGQQQTTDPSTTDSATTTTISQQALATAAASSSTEDDTSNHGSASQSSACTRSASQSSTCTRSASQSSALDGTRSDSQSSALDGTRSDSQSLTLDGTRSDSQSSALDSTRSDSQSLTLDGTRSDSQSSALDSTRSDSQSSALDGTRSDSQSSALEGTRSDSQSSALDGTRSDSQSSALDGTQSVSQSSALEGTQSPHTQSQPEDTPLSDYSLWPKDTHPKTTPAAVYASDAVDDFSQQYLLYNLHALAKHLGEVMFILSTVNFQNYLNRGMGKQQQFPRPRDLQKNLRGELDFLVIHRHRGVLVGEMKSVGKQQAEMRLSQDDDDACVVKRVEKGVRQLVKGGRVVSHLVSDVLQGLPVVAALFLPFVSRSQLLRVLSAKPALAQDVCSCLDVSTSQEAVDMTLCSDDLSDPNDYREVTPHVLSQLASWWQRRMAPCAGQVLSDDQYTDIIGRFIGPATTVSVHCNTRPRLTIEVRTEGEAVAELGMRLARLVLTPEQVDLLNRAPPRAYLTGPPGTGKSVMLILMGLVWLLQGRNVQIVSLWDNSKAACELVYHQIKRTLQDSASDTGGVPGATGQVSYHSFNFHGDIHGEKASVKTVVEALTEAVQNQPPCVIIDEASFEAKAEVLVRKLQKLFPNLHLWAANIKRNSRFKELPTERMTIPLRSAPRVVQELQKALDSSYYIGKVEPYCMDGIPCTGDGLDPTEILHQGPPHTGDRLISCFHCGVEVAKALRDLGVGKPDRLVPNSPDSLQFRDVLVLERDKTHPPYDDIRDPEGTVLLPASDLVRGLREEGVPVRVVEDRRYVEDLEYQCRWEKHRLKGCTVPQDQEVLWEKHRLKGCTVPQDQEVLWEKHRLKGCTVPQDQEVLWEKHRLKGCTVPQDQEVLWEKHRLKGCTVPQDQEVLWEKHRLKGCTVPQDQEVLWEKHRLKGCTVPQDQEVLWEKHRLKGCTVPQDQEVLWEKHRLKGCTVPQDQEVLWEKHRLKGCTVPQDQEVLWEKHRLKGCTVPQDQEVLWEKHRLKGCTVPQDQEVLWEKHRLKGCTVPQDQEVLWEKHRLKGCTVPQDQEVLWEKHRLKGCTVPQDQEVLWEKHRLKGCTVPQDQEVLWEKMSLEEKESWLHHFEKGCEVESQEADERWKTHRQKSRKEWDARRHDMSTARHDEVIVTTKQLVQGLERKVVVALLKSMVGLNTEDRIRCLSRCTTHLVFVYSGDSTQVTSDASGDSANRSSQAKAASKKSSKSDDASKKPKPTG